MRINEFVDSNYLQGLSDNPIVESADQLIKTLSGEVDETRQAAIDAGGKDGTQVISKFLESRIRTYVALRTLLALDTKIQRGEFDEEEMDNYRRLVRTFYEILTKGSVEQVIDVFDRFYVKHSSANSRFHPTLKGFEKDLFATLRMNDKSGIVGMPVLDMMKSHLTLVDKQAAEYRIEHDPNKDKAKKPEFSESVDSLFEQLELLESRGLLDMVLVESTETQPATVSAYYAIVSGKVIVDGKHHRNVKSVVVGRGVDGPSAIKDIKRSTRESVSIINKSLKKENAKLEVDLDNIGVASFDVIKKKNIDNLVGTRLVSRGYILLDGVTEHGGLGKEVKYAPLGYTFLNKSSVTRYLNKDR